VSLAERLTIVVMEEIGARDNEDDFDHQMEIGVSDTRWCQNKASLAEWIDFRDHRRRHREQELVAQRLVSRWRWQCDLPWLLCGLLTRIHRIYGLGLLMVGYVFIYMKRKMARYIGKINVILK
jgi:hypothetical protein